MKVYKNKNMQEWHPENGTHYSQKITMTEDEQKEYGLNYSKGKHYPNLSILDCFPSEVWKQKKLNYCNTFIEII